MRVNLRRGPVAQLATAETAIVLAGDDKQIAPPVQSVSARHHGLKKSMLVRLTDDHLSKRNGWQVVSRPRFAHASVYDAHAVSSHVTERAVQVELTVNYRSHPKLLDMPSQLFYKGSLTSGVKPGAMSQFCQWRRLPQKGTPLLFIGVEGNDK